MRHKLALTIALGGCAGSILAGGGFAGAQSGISVGGANLPAPPQVDVPLPACANGVDDDGDGLVDLADSGCVSSAGTSEGGAPAPPPVPVPVPTEPPDEGGGGGGGDGAGGGGGGGGGAVPPAAVISAESSAAVSARL